MSQPSPSPPRSAGRSARSSPPMTPARGPMTPAQRARAGGSPVASVDEPGSRSPAFGRTPESGPSVGSPLAVAAAASPPARAVARSRNGSEGMRTPARRSGVPAASPPSSRYVNKATHRGFLGSVPSPPSSRDPTGWGDDEAGEPEDGTFIYGTNINEMRIVKDFHAFIKKFRLPEAPEAEEAYYLHQLNKLWDDAAQQKDTSIKFPINGAHVLSFNPKLYERLVQFPAEVIPIFDRELWDISVRVLRAEPEDLGTCQVQVFGLGEEDQKMMRQMNPSDIERLITIKGIVIRCSDLMPDMSSAVFRCTVEDCQNQVGVPLSHWNVEEPTRCERCGSNHSFQIVHNECTFIDKQVLKLQEPPELVPEGETPQNVAINCFDDLVDTVRPGDRVEVTGIYRASAVRPMRNWKTCNSVYRTYIDAISVASSQQAKTEPSVGEEEDNVPGTQQLPRLADELDLKEGVNTKEDIAFHRKIREIAAERDEDGKPTVVQKLVASLAPSIFEEDEVKKGLLCQLFGGTPKAASQSSKGRCRPEINTLLCGDPSTAKSQLLQYVHKLAPRGMYTSGKGSSAVGLTASVNKDPITKEIVLESGALVLADRGICCIDEFDKMDENARAILHEAMEQQTVSVAKAGIVCSLNARTSILASANPKESCYDQKLSVVENIHLPKNLMTRFDFIWLMIDKRNRDTDRRLAEHIVSKSTVSGAKAEAEPPLDSQLFRRYIAFAKRWCRPQITDESQEALIKGYISLRNQGNSREAITATPRILESLIRISESLAKMELREEVAVADVDEAIRLMKAATYAAAIDPDTGLIDMEQLIVGISAQKRKRVKDLETMMQEIFAERKSRDEGMMTIDTLKSVLNERLGAQKEQLATDLEFERTLKTAEQQSLVRRQGTKIEVR